WSPHPTTDWSWACGTVTLMWKAYSSTRNRSLPRTATPCCPTSSPEPP
ncbi:uncharacterized protein METZ01_LOCUS295597, partial [marine metagenome]